MNRTLPIASQPVARASVPPTSDNVITIPNDTRIFMTVLLFAGPVHEAHYTRGKPPLLDRLPPRAWVQEVSRRSLSGSTSCENRRHEFCLRVTVPRHMAPATNSAPARRRHEPHKRAHRGAARHCGLPSSVLRSFTVERGPILLRVVVVVHGERRGAAVEH